MLEAARRDNNERRFWTDLHEGLGFGSYMNGDSWNRANVTIRPQDFSIRELFEEFVPHGRELVRSFSPRKHGRSEVSLLEAGAVDTSAFSNISGQIFFASTLDAFNSPEFIADRLTRTVQTDLQEEEKIPGISLPGDVAEKIGENQPYPEVGLSEEWVMTPEKIKEGFILPISKEAIFGDRTGLLLDRASTGARMMAINKEKRVLDEVLGVNTSYRRNGGAAQAAYGNTHTNGDFDNLSNTALQDYSDIEAALLLFDAITDPGTGELISISSTQIVVPTALLFTARSIVNATEVRTTTNTNTQSLAPNPLAPTPMTVESNAYVKDRSSSATAWWIGDFQRAFTYRQNWPITTEEERETGPRAFSHDTIARFKVSEKGVPATEEPRYVVQGNS